MYDKCSTCLKKSHIIFECKCHKKFCNKHILPEIHNCENIKDHKLDSFKKNESVLLQNKTVSIKVETI